MSLKGALAIRELAAMDDDEYERLLPEVLDGLSPRKLTFTAKAITKLLRSRSASSMATEGTVHAER